MRAYRTRLAPLAALMLAACTATSQPAATSAPSPCRPEAAKSLIGASAIDDAGVRRISGASLVRRLTPGAPMTMDFRRERVTLEVDRAGRILKAFCG